MGRVYAGILGPLAFFAAIGHGLVHAGDPQQILWWAMTALFAFAAIGFVAGQLAEWIVQDSVRASLAEEVARRQSAGTGTASPKQP